MAAILVNIFGIPNKFVVVFFFPTPRSQVPSPNLFGLGISDLPPRAILSPGPFFSHKFHPDLEGGLIYFHYRHFRQRKKKKQFM